MLLNLVALSPTATAYLTDDRKPFQAGSSIFPDLSLAPKCDLVPDQKKINTEILESNGKQAEVVSETQEKSSSFVRERTGSLPKETLASWVNAAHSETLLECVYIFSVICHL